MSSWEDGARQGEKIGNAVFIGFRILWFFARIAWWLAVLLIASLIAGVAALVRSGRPGPEVPAGFGHFEEGNGYWEDEKSGVRYPAVSGQVDTCEVQAIEGRMHWQRTALSRLVKRGAIVRYTFAAISDGHPDGAREIVASTEFLKEARRNITLDHLDPAQATASDPYWLEQGRSEAVDAFKELNSILTSGGWEWNKRPRSEDEDPGDLPGHWYGRTYTRPKILWDQPVSAAGPPPGMEP